MASKKRGSSRREQLVIEAYSDIERESSTKVGTFHAALNPDTISRSYGHAFQNASKVGINSSARPAQFSYSSSQTLSVQIIVDETGIMGASALGARPDQNQTAFKRVDQFLRLCYNYEPDQHQPCFLVLKWSEQTFSCRLVSLEVTYSEFDRGGNALRAELDTVFIEDRSKKETSLQNTEGSPDMTQTHVIQAGDSLPALSRKYYGDAQLYTAVARFNRLQHFRELPTGQEVLFPPAESLPNIQFLLRI